MERHKCKLCFKSFSNGRALGGHMRSHIWNLQLPANLENSTNQHSDKIESASSSFSGKREEEEQGLCYKLRENPKKSVRLVDPEFSFKIDDESVVVIQDRESETESSKNPIPNRRGSKRNHEEHSRNEFRFSKLSKMTESIDHHESVSSISDSSTENVAFSLMMLSRDTWIDKSEEIFRKIRRNRVKYKCETCKKSFRSYQALGGHRASHKKIKICISKQESRRITGNSLAKEERIYECPICFRVFASGQALGGHKRSHGAGLDAELMKLGEIGIDLNVPFPIVDDDDVDEISAVCDAEFVNLIE